MTFTLNKSTVQTTTPIDLLRLPDEAALEKAFVGKHISTLRTPAIILDRELFRANCVAMAASSASKGFTFRAHVKTHKATKGVRMQLEAGNGCTAVVCSTMMECWKLVEDGLVADGSIKDVRYYRLLPRRPLTDRCCMGCLADWTRSKISERWRKYLHVMVRSCV